MSSTPAAAWETFRRPPIPDGEVDLDLLDIGLDVRLDDDAQDLAELANSISELGVLQAVTVRPTAGGRYEVTAGRRRVAAARIAGLESIPATVRDLDDEQAFDAAIAENLHRRELSPVEVGLAFARLRDRGLNQGQIAARVGRSQGTVSALLAVLDLPADLRAKVHRRELSYRTALDQAGRRERRRAGGGHDQPEREVKSISADVVTYWRRRHDRLIAAVLRLRRARADGLGLAQVLTAIDAVVELDAQPVDDVPTPIEAR